MCLYVYQGGHATAQDTWQTEAEEPLLAAHQPPGRLSTPVSKPRATYPDGICALPKTRHSQNSARVRSPFDCGLRHRTTRRRLRVLRRPQYVGKGSFMSGVWAAAQGRLQTRTPQFLPRLDGGFTALRVPQATIAALLPPWHVIPASAVTPSAPRTGEDPNHQGDAPCPASCGTPGRHRRCSRKRAWCPRR